MDRLTLSCQHKTADREQCLPAGDGLPLWSTLPLDAKFPMVPNNPKGSVVLCTTKLGQKKHRRQQDSDFDLGDPYGHVVFNEYLALHDPHLKELFSSPQMKRHLIRKQFITSDGKVICNLKEFNQYRRYLRRICLMEIARERTIKDEEERGVREELLRTTKAEMKRTDERLNTVRNRLMQIREQTRKNLEIAIQVKTEKLKKQLDELALVKLEKEAKRQKEDKKKQIALLEHQEEIKRRNLEMIRRWRVQESLHAKRMEEQRRRRILEQRRKSLEMWETRKRIQKERMEHEARILRIEQEAREKNISNRERTFKEQRERMKVQLEQLKEQAKREQEQREKSHSSRLSKRLAACHYKAWVRQRARRGHKRYSSYKSLWPLEETIRRFIIPEILPEIVLDAKDYKSSTTFLHMLNEAIDQTVDIVVQSVQDDEDYEIQERAQEIVNSVIQNVFYGGWPGSPDIVKRDELIGETEAYRSRSVRFTEEESVITTGLNLDVDVSDLKPVSLHQLTPGPSPLNLQGEVTEADENIKMVENLLKRLLDDLENDRLSADHLIKLSTHCIYILNEIQEEDSSRDSGDYQGHGAADELVRFTLGRILEDIKSGRISSEQLTDLTLSILGAQSVDGDSEDGIDHFIDETISSFVKDREIQDESPVHEYMLDDFIITTIHNIADDVGHGRLSKDMISNMFCMLSRELDSYRDESSLEGILQRILEDLDTEKSETLYRIVHAVITSYYTYRESATESLSNLVTNIVSRLNSVIELGEISDSDIDVHALAQVAVKLSTASLSTLQLNQFASDISSALYEGRPKSYSPLAKKIVDDVIRDVKDQLVLADGMALKRIASVVTVSYQNIVRQEPYSEMSLGDHAEMDSNLQKVSLFVVKVLKLVKRYLDEGEFSSDDIRDMTSLLFEMNSETIHMETTYARAEFALNEYVTALISEVEKGKMGNDELRQLGDDLISFGQRMVTATMSKSSSQSICSRPSLTSTAIADDFVSHVISSMEADLSRGVMSSDSLKELAVCILKPTISRDNISFHKEQYEPDTSIKHPSPCESQLAGDVVECTLETIMKDLQEASLLPATICSIATSVVSLLSGDEEQYRSTIQKILKDLKDDNIDQTQAQQIFSIILDHYKTEKETQKKTKSFFKKRTSATSNSLRAESFIVETLHKIERELGEESDSDSVLAESLIRETLNKIKRDIESGNITDDDMVSLMADSERKIGRVRSTSEAASTEIISFILAILHECLVSIEVGEIPGDAMIEFLSVMDANFDPSNEKHSVEYLKRKLRQIILDIKTKGKHSVFVKYIVFAASRKAIKTQKASKGELSSPLGALQTILQSVEPNILTNFVRMTLQSVLKNISDDAKAKSDVVFDGKSVPDYILQSTSSVVASNVVRNLIAKMESMLLPDGSLRSDYDFTAFGSASDKMDKPVGDYAVALSSASSRYLGEMILQTLNNIVSNLRLEKSLGQSPSEDWKGDVQRRKSSQMLDDFVLGKLQDIIESMQDSILFDFKDLRRGDESEREVGFKKSSSLPMTDKEASFFVTSVLRDVVQDFAKETTGSADTAEEQTSTLSLEAENIVIGTLYNIVQQFSHPKEDESLFEPDDTEIKIYVLNVLENIKQNINDTSDETVRTAVTKIMKPEKSDVNKDQVGESESRDFLESTIDFIIEHIKEDRLKASDVYNQTMLSSPDSDEMFDDRGDFELDGTIARPSLSLQKMSEMTGKMLKLYDDIHKFSDERCSSGTKLQKLPHKPSFRSIFDLQEVVTETIKQTISNVVEGKLSEGETSALASALCNSTAKITDDPLDTSKVSSTSLPGDSMVSGFIVDMLQRTLDEIQYTGADSKTLESITDCIMKSEMIIACKDKGSSCSSLSSGASEVVMEAVKDLIEAVRTQLTDDDQTKQNKAGKKNSESSQSSTPRKVTSDHSTKSGTSESSNTISETSSKGNVNPNASIRKRAKLLVAPPRGNVGAKSPTVSTQKSLKPNGIETTRKRVGVTKTPVISRSDIKNGKDTTQLLTSTSQKTCLLNKETKLPSPSIGKQKGKTDVKLNIDKVKVDMHSNAIGKSRSKMDAKLDGDKVKVDMHSKPFSRVSKKIENAKAETDSVIQIVISPLVSNKASKSGESRSRSFSVQEKRKDNKTCLITEGKRSASKLDKKQPTKPIEQREKRVYNLPKLNAKRRVLTGTTKNGEEKVSEREYKKRSDPLEISSLCGSHKSKVMIRSVNEDPEF